MTKKDEVIDSIESEPLENNSLRQQIECIFDEAQRSIGVHKVLQRKLKNLIIEDNVDEGLDVILKGCMDRVLIQAKKEPAAERLVKFFCNFIVSSASQHSNIFNKGIEHMLTRSLGTDKSVRFRSVQIIATILQDMPSDTEIDENLWNALGQIITPRLRDRAPNVRLWAIQAVSRLQNPEDEENYIINELLRLMGTDVSVDIRIAAVETIVICPESLPGIVERIRDIKPDVRLAALESLRKANVGVRNLNAALRAQVVQYGLTDRDDQVKTSARKLIFDWIESLDCNVPKLFHYLNLHSNRIDVTQAGRHCQGVAYAIMNELDNGNLISSELRRSTRDSLPNWEGGFDSLTPADLLWAVARCEYAAQCFSAGSAMELNDALVPDALRLIELLLQAHGSIPHPTRIGSYSIVSRDEGSDHYKLRASPQRQLSFKYLLRMCTTKLADAVGDSDGTRKLALVCHHLLKDADLPSSLVPSVLSALSCTASQADVLQSSARLCSGLYEQIKKMCIEEDDEEDVKVESTNDNNNDTDDYIKDEDYMQAAIVRSMEIASWVFKQTVSVGDATKLGTAVVALVSEMTPMIWESMQQNDTEIRALAIKCFGLLGAASAAGMTSILVKGNDDNDSIPQLSEREMLLFVAENEIEEPELRCTAVMALCDMVSVENMFVTPIVSPGDPEGKEQLESSKLHLIKFVDLLNNLVKSDIETVACVATEAAAKMLLNGAIHDSTLLAHLVVAFYQPRLLFGESAITAHKLAMDDSDLLISAEPQVGSQAHLQQCLCLFFATYSKSVLNGNVDKNGNLPIEVTKEIQKRQRTVLQSIESVLLALTSDNAKDSGCSSGAISHVCGGFLELAESFPTSNDVSINGNLLVESMRGSITAITLREMLRLGNNKSSTKKIKAIQKDLMKILPVVINGGSWLLSLECSSNVSSQVMATCLAVLKEIDIDKATQTVIRSLSTIASENNVQEEEEEINSVNNVDDIVGVFMKNNSIGTSKDFYGRADGLESIVLRFSSNEIDAGVETLTAALAESTLTTGTTKKKTTTTTKKAVRGKKKVESSDEEESDDDNEVKEDTLTDLNENGEVDEKDAENTLNVKTTKTTRAKKASTATKKSVKKETIETGRPTRSARGASRAAAEKMKAIAADDH